MEGATSLRFTTQAQSDIRRITANLADLQSQISSGMRAHDLVGFGGGSTPLLSANGMKAATDARSSVVSQLSSRLDVQAIALSQAAAGARGLGLSIREAVSAGDGRGIATALELAFSAIVGALNQTYNGQPLFAGERLDVSPIRATTLDQLVAATNTADIFDESVRHQVVDLGDGQQVRLAAKASEMSQDMFDALRDLRAMLDAAGGSIGQPIDGSTQAALIIIAGRIEASTDAITNEEGRTGQLLATFDTERTKLTQRSDLLSKVFEDHAGADLAQVSIKLNVLMAQYEAAAKTFSDLSKLTLLNYL